LLEIYTFLTYKKEDRKNISTSVKLDKVFNPVSICSLKFRILSASGVMDGGYGGCGNNFTIWIKLLYYGIQSLMELEINIEFFRYFTE